MKLYAVRVEKTLWLDVHVVAESEEAATDYALNEAESIFADGDPGDEVTADTFEAHGGWEPGELPYLTDAAAEAVREITGKAEATCAEWSKALADAAPVVDTDTLPLALSYDDGRTERVTAVPQARAAGGGR